MTPAAELEGLVEAYGSAKSAADTYRAETDQPDELDALLSRQLASARAALLAYGERLVREREEARHGERSSDKMLHEASHDRDVWHKAFRAAEARAERLEKALRPFAKAIQEVTAETGKYGMTHLASRTRFEDWDEAAAALASPSAGRE